MSSDSTRSLRRDGAEPLQARAHQLGDGGLARPRARRGDLRGRRDFRIQPALRVDSLDHGQAFGANPECGFAALSLDAQACGAAREDQRFEVRAPARALASLVDFAGGEHTEGIERIVQFVGTRDVRPRFLAHLRYGRRIEPAHVRPRSRDRASGAE
jgi:hypothetical protein